MQEKRDSSARGAPRNDKKFDFSASCEACATEFRQIFWATTRPYTNFPEAKPALIARNVLRKFTNIAPFVAASFHNDLFLMRSKPRSQVLAQFLLRISLLIIFNPFDLIQASYSCIVPNSTSIPFSMGMMSFLYSDGLRFCLLNQSITAN